MNTWIDGKKFNETSIPPIEAFYRELNLEDITDEDYTHVQKIWDVFEIKIAASIMTYMFKVTRYSLQMYLKTLELSVLKYMGLILLIFVST